MATTSLTVTVQTTNGERDVPVIYRRGVWAVTPAVNGNAVSETEFVVTHLPSGRKAMHDLHIGDADRAINLCRCLAEADEHWEHDAAPRSSPTTFATPLRAAYLQWLETLERAS